MPHLSSAQLDLSNRPHESNEKLIAGALSLNLDVPNIRESWGNTGTKRLTRVLLSLD
mgnify:CR=1 FL=1